MDEGTITAVVARAILSMPLPAVCAAGGTLIQQRLRKQHPAASHLLLSWRQAVPGITAHFKDDCDGCFYLLNHHWVLQARAFAACLLDTKHRCSFVTLWVSSRHWHRYSWAQTRCCKCSYSRWQVNSSVDCTSAQGSLSAVAGCIGCTCTRLRQLSCSVPLLVYSAQPAVQ
jgi:hypothetical protein